MQNNKNPNIFIGLLIVSVLLLLVLVVVFTYLSSLWGIMIIAAMIFILFTSAGIFGIFLSVTQQKVIPLLKKPMRFTISVFYPVVLFIGPMLGSSKDNIRGSFIAVHNQLAELERVRVKGNEILLLLPHCIQWTDCSIKITNDVTNCVQCGRCTISDLRDLQKEYGFHMAVATGGTLARKIIIEVKPKVVIAVACERDLASGIKDVQQIHVRGITNDRPYGPCFNTTVSLVDVEQTIQDVIKGGM